MARRRPISSAELIRVSIETILQEAHFSIPAKVVKYSGQRADVAPQVSRCLMDDDDNVLFESLPVVSNCIVYHPGSKWGGLHVPVQAGDACTLVFSEQDYRVWKSTGEQSDPQYTKRFPLTSPVVFVGTAHDKQLWQTLANGLRLGKDNADQQVVIDDSFITAGVGGDVLPTKADYNALMSALLVFAAAASLTAIDTTIGTAALTLKTALTPSPPGTAVPSYTTIFKAK